MAFKKYSKLCFISFYLYLSAINSVNNKRSHIAAAKSTAYTTDHSANDSPRNCTNTSKPSTYSNTNLCTKCGTGHSTCPSSNCIGRGTDRVVSISIAVFIILIISNNAINHFVSVYQFSGWTGIFGYSSAYSGHPHGTHILVSIEPTLAPAVPIYFAAAADSRVSAVTFQRSSYAVQYCVCTRNDIQNTNACMP